MKQYHALPIEIRIACEKAAKEDLYSLDLTTTNEQTSDQAHGFIPSTLKITKDRFKRILDIVPFHLMEIVEDYINHCVDALMLDRMTRARRLYA